MIYPRAKLWIPNESLSVIALAITMIPRMLGDKAGSQNLPWAFSAPLNILAQETSSTRGDNSSNIMNIWWAVSGDKLVTKGSNARADPTKIPVKGTSTRVVARSTPLRNRRVSTRSSRVSVTNGTKTDSAAAEKIEAIKKTIPYAKKKASVSRFTLNVQAITMGIKNATPLPKVSNIVVVRPLYMIRLEDIRAHTRDGASNNDSILLRPQLLNPCHRS
jgi:hypothetical protein